MNEVPCPHCQQLVGLPRGAGESADGGSPILDCPHCDRSFARPIAPPAESDALTSAPIDWAAAGVSQPESRRKPAFPTEVPVALSGIAGLLLTVLFYAVVVAPFS
jgi:hypothetical protein